MNRKLKYASIALVVLAGAQLIRPDRTNPPSDTSRSIQAHVEADSGLIPVLNRSCGDCHSNATTWPWYTQAAPLSWLMAYAVGEGRKAVNFSDWAAYSPPQQQQLLDQSFRDATSGKMPSGVWVALRPEARLSAQDVETICAVARQTKTAAGNSR